MRDDLLETLALVNPVETEAVEVSPQLSARVLETTSPSSKRARRPVVAGAVGAVAVATAVMLVVSAGGGASNLAARAYAAVRPHGVVHWRTELLGYANGRLGSRQLLEGWSLGRVTHVLHSDVIHGKAHVTADVRLAGRRSRTWMSVSNDYDTGRVSHRREVELIPSGDPMAAFRQAYRAGRLRDLGDGRLDLRFAHLPAGSAVYHVDPSTGQPRRLVLRVDRQAVRGQPAFHGKTVIRFSVYESLPPTSVNRARLALLPHPGAGPGRQPAQRYFAALRTGPPPDAEHAAKLRDLASHLKRFDIDPAGIRTVSDGLWLLPGRGYVCLASEAANSLGASCVTVRKARQFGIAVGRPDHTIVAVPDGVQAVAARLHWHGHFQRYPVRHGVAVLPGLGYQILLVH